MKVIGFFALLSFCRCGFLRLNMMACFVFCLELQNHSLGKSYKRVTFVIGSASKQETNHASLAIVIGSASKLGQDEMGIVKVAFW